MTSNQEQKILLRDVIAPGFYELHKQIKTLKSGDIWCKGGRGSTKSTFVSVETLLGLLKDPDANAVVVRQYQTDLRKTVYGQFQWTIGFMGLSSEFVFHTSPMEIIRKATGQKIVFESGSTAISTKSYNLGRGYIKYVIFEELDQFPGMQTTRTILQSMFRGKDRPRIAFYVYNPPKSARAWVNKEAKIPKPGKIVHHSTYKDVPREWLGTRFLTDAEHLEKTNPTAYAHEYLGEEVGTGLEVFNNLIITRIPDETVAAITNPRHGLDFGYAVDPVAFERMNFDRKRKRLQFLWEFTGIGISDEQLFAATKEYHREKTVADSSEPKSIQWLRDHGMNVYKSVKGPDSVNFGIKFLQGLEAIVIDPERTPRAFNEFTNYSLELTKSGETISRYPDKDNHTIDAARYALEQDSKDADVNRMIKVRGGQ